MDNNPKSESLLTSMFYNLPVAELGLYFNLSLTYIPTLTYLCGYIYTSNSETKRGNHFYNYRTNKILIKKTSL